jgi:hypothetical protein
LNNHFMMMMWKKSSSATHHGGTWGERRYSSYSNLTSALDGVSGQGHAPATLYPWGKRPRYPLDRRLGWAPEPVWMQRLEEKSSASVRDRTLVIQSVVSHFSDWATPALMTCDIGNMCGRQCLDQNVLNQVVLQIN